MLASSPNPPAAARLHALVPCAGSGSRAQTAVPKQYQALAGRPLVRHTLDALAGVPRLASVLVVVAPGDDALASVPGITLAPCGGATRAASVRNGLRELLARGAAQDDWVLVHDAARCLLTPELVNRLIDECHADPVGGLLAQPLADTLKQEEGGRAHVTLPRAGKWLAQTPQMFRIGLLAEALDAAHPQVTDEASAVEALGLAPRLVRGSAHNFKVTWPEDFALAEAILSSRSTA